MDLRNNKIEENGVKDMANFLKSNKTLLNLDLRFNIGFTSVLHRKVAISLLNNLRRAKLDPKVDEQKWMNPELLTIEVPENMVASIQQKLNSLVEYPIDESPGRQSSRNEDMGPLNLHIRPNTAKSIHKGMGKKSSTMQKLKRKVKALKTNNQSTERELRKLRSKKVPKERMSKIIQEENALYQMASDSNKKNLESQLEYFIQLNDHLAKENESLMKKLSRYEGAQPNKVKGSNKENKINEEVKQEGVDDSGL